MSATLNIIKRDGSKAEFDKLKIENAILKAMKYGSGVLEEDIAKDIAEEIEKIYLQGSPSPTVSKVEELVYKDISVVGFNNIPLSQYKNPPLASVDINSEKLGRYATKLIIDKLENRENKGYHVIETNLIERESLK